MKNILACLLVSLSLVIFVGSSVPKSNGSKKLLFVMLDGFRYDYVDDQPPESLPGFTRFLQNGVRAEYMSPTFPSLSYPNWVTLVTGLWAESHGVVANFFHGENGNEFSLFDDESTGNKMWWTAEPISTTATKANLKTGAILWSRCDVPFDGVKLAYCEPYVSTKGHENFRSNMEKSLNKLEQGFDFIQVYYEHIDTVGHVYGPETEERKQAVRDVDTIIVEMLDRIEKMSDQVNVVIVSDHGMTSTAPGAVQKVEFDDYLLTDYVESIGQAGAFSNIKVKEGFVDQVYDKLKTMPGVEVYKHDEIPERLHFKNNKYIYDIVVKADIDTFIMLSHSKGMLPPRKNDNVGNGAHGYDSIDKKMRAIFFATGPDFKSGAKIPSIQNVDVYPLLAHLLKIDPLPNNGTFENVKMALTLTPDPTSKAGFVTMATSVLIPLIIATSSSILTFYIL